MSITNVAHADASVKSVDIDADGNIDIGYSHKGWFLGFIPVHITSHTMVDTSADGTAEVQVKLPWWRFLVRGVSSIADRVEAELQDNSSVSAEIHAQANADARVALIESIIASLQASASANVQSQ